LRSVAVLALVGVAATIAPTAAARSQAGPRALLNDAAAFEAALQASAQAGPGEDARTLFVAAYVETAGGDLTAETVERVLGGPVMGDVAPPVRPIALVPAPPAGPAPTLGAVVLAEASTERVADGALAGTAPDVPAPSGRPAHEPRQPRGP
jgi:hypothetical protein